MNERIKVLLEKAGASTGEYYRNPDDPNRSYSKSIVDDWSEDFKTQLQLEPYLRVREMDEDTLNKFVELIIRECARVAHRHTPDYEELEYSHLIKNKILEHFEVE